MKQLIYLFAIIFSCYFAINECSAQSPVFVENTDVFEDRSRRKFGNPVIADLDQDGYLDILLTEHARRVEVYWNNAGTFELGNPFIFGDTHGLAIGDFDRDGLIEVVVERGGGGGNNPSKTEYFKINLDRTAGSKMIFSDFVGGSGRAAKLLDGNNDGALDLMTTVWPQLDAIPNAHTLYKNSGDGSSMPYDFLSQLPAADRWNIRASLTDFNNDNITDVLFYGGNQILAVKGEGNLEYTNATSATFGSLSTTNGVNSISEIDFDNDGDLDLFLTRSRTPFGSENEYDEATNTFYFFNRQEANPWDYDSLEIDGDFEIENVQMAFPDFDIFIGADTARYVRTEDSHGHFDINLTQTEADGFPVDWSADTYPNGLYIGYIGNNIWRVAGRTRSATSGVIHNVLSGAPTIPLNDMPAKLLENVDGQYVDVTADLGIDILEQTTSSAVGDYNNDGWDDILVIRYGDPSVITEQILYLNENGTNFVKAVNHGIITNELGATGMGAEAFDYDQDGDLDILYCNERGRWHLYTNNTNLSDSNYVQVNIGSSPNCFASAVGARLTLNICGETYERTVGRSSAPYSQSFNTFIHVGLGSCNVPGTATINWTNGEEIEINITDLNMIYQVGFNGQCPPVVSTVFVSDDATEIEIFPNPTNSKFTLKSTLSIEAISIYDLTGRLVLSKQIEANNGEAMEIDMQSISKGSYFLKVHSSGKTYVKKIIRS